MDIASLLAPKIATPSAGITRGPVAPFSANSLIAMTGNNAAQGVQASISSTAAQRVAASTALDAAATEPTGNAAQALFAPQSAFVAKSYYSGSPARINLNTAIPSTPPQSAQAQAPAEDAPRVNAQGQVTGLLLSAQA